MRRKAWLTHTHAHAQAEGQICETCPLHCVIITQVLLGTALPSSPSALAVGRFSCSLCVCAPSSTCTTLPSHAHHPLTPYTPPPHHTAARFPASQPYRAS